MPGVTCHLSVCKKDFFFTYLYTYKFKKLRNFKLEKVVELVGGGTYKTRLLRPVIIMTIQIMNLIWPIKQGKIIT